MGLILECCGNLGTMGGGVFMYTALDESLSHSASIELVSLVLEPSVLLLASDLHITMKHIEKLSIEKKTCLVEHPP